MDLNNYWEARRRLTQLEARRELVKELKDQLTSEDHHLRKIIKQIESELIRKEQKIQGN